MDRTRQACYCARARSQRRGGDRVHDGQRLSVLNIDEGDQPDDIRLTRLLPNAEETAIVNCLHLRRITCAHIFRNAMAPLASIPVAGLSRTMSESVGGKVRMRTGSNHLLPSLQEGYKSRSLFRLAQSRFLSHRMAVPGSLLLVAVIAFVILCALFVEEAAGNKPYILNRYSPPPTAQHQVVL